MNVQQDHFSFGGRGKGGDSKRKTETTKARCQFLHYQPLTNAKSLEEAAAMPASKLTLLRWTHLGQKIRTEIQLRIPVDQGSNIHSQGIKRVSFYISLANQTQRLQKIWFENHQTEANDLFQRIGGLQPNYRYVLYFLPLIMAVQWARTAQITNEEFIGIDSPKPFSGLVRFPWCAKF